SQLKWVSSLDGNLGTGASISATTLTIGTHVITASVTDSSGAPGQAQVTVRVRGPNVAPVVTITAPTNNGSVAAGTPVTLTATATDDFDGPLTSQIRWTSNLDNALGTGGSITKTLSEGQH